MTRRGSSRIAAFTEQIQHVPGLSEDRVQIAPSQRPLQNSRSHDGHPLDRVLVNSVPVISEAVQEHGHAQLASVRSRRSEKKVRARSDRDTIAFTQIGLGFDQPSLAVDPQEVADPAANDLLMERPQTVTRSHEAKGLNESILKLALGASRQADSVQSLHRFQPRRDVQNGA